MDEIIDKYLNEGMKKWNYVFPNAGEATRGAFTIQAVSKKAAISKIKKQWGISDLSSGFFIWSDDEEPPKGFEGYNTTYRSRKI